MKDDDSSESCIKCHMPKVKGGVENFDKKSRFFHKSHRFLGIHDAKFRQSGIDINISNSKDEIILTLKNKMAHPLIIQPARVKFFKIELFREGKKIWQNYKVTPSEDKKGYFSYFFKNSNNKKTIIPNKATKMWSNNLKADERRSLRYKVLDIKNRDLLKVKYFVQFAKNDCKEIIDLNDSNLVKPQLIKEVEKYLDKPLNK